MSELDNIDSIGKYTIYYFWSYESAQLPNINYYGL